MTRIRRPRKAPTVQDLLRHTAGLTYEILGTEPIQKQYAQAQLASRDRSNAEFATALAAMPLMFEPGTTWEYSRATDLLGGEADAAGRVHRLDHRVRQLGQGRVESDNFLALGSQTGSL